LFDAASNLGDLLLGMSMSICEMRVQARYGSLAESSNRHLALPFETRKPARYGLKGYKKVTIPSLSLPRTPGSALIIFDN
jgi:hypothetical protein